MGLSPRVRGNLVPLSQAIQRDGPIPASAGEPGCRAPAARRPGAYPRECGGTRWLSTLKLSEEGLSPRVRGNQAIAPERESRGGPIPASAGEPPGPAWPVGCLRAYPRECGGTIQIPSGALAGAGLSPRVRGNPRC